MCYRVVYWNSFKDFQDNKEPEWEELETRRELYEKVNELGVKGAIVQPQYIDDEGKIVNINI